jgi:hypothetical protein
MAKIPVAFTRYSSIGNIMAMEKGPAMFRALTASREDDNQQAATILGDSDTGMIEAMKREMSLPMIVRLADISDEQLEGMLDELNR